MICTICGSPKESKLHSLCQKCAPYIYGKYKFPHQKLRRRKVWKKNREKRLKEANYTCEWCYKNNDVILSVHHEMEVNYKTYKILWDAFVYEKIEDLIKIHDLNQNYCEIFIQYYVNRSIKNAIKYHERKAEIEVVYCCPYCGSTNYDERRTKKPKYRCYGCYQNFAKLKSRSSLKTLEKIRQLKKFLNGSKKVSYNIVFDVQFVWDYAVVKLEEKVLPLFYDEIIQKYDDAVKDLLDKYMKMNNTIVLCKKCHHYARIDFTICKKCRKNYHHKNKRQCKECLREDNYCYKCRNKNSIFCPQCHILFNQLDSEICPKCGKLYFQDNEILQSLLKVTADELREQHMEGDLCLLCKDMLSFDHLPNYLYFITKENEHFQMGFLCAQCVDKIKDSYKPEDNDSIQIKIAHNPIN